jgi:hypothetical protein
MKPEMHLRSLLLVAAVALLSACNKEAETGSASRDRIDCRIGPATTFERVCSIEQGDSARGRVLTIRKPDGGFRRLLVTLDGRGVVAADGSEAATVNIHDRGRIDVAVGGDTFRLPATVQP